MPIGIAIDHVLVWPDFAVLDRAVGPHIGSDHRPVHVDVMLTADGKGSKSESVD